MKIRKKIHQIEVCQRHYTSNIVARAVNDTAEKFRKGAVLKAAACDYFLEVKSTHDALDVMTSDIPAATVRAWAQKLLRAA